MEKKSIATVEPEIRDAYQKALRVPEESKRLIALMEIVQQEPGFIEARTKLRDLERKKMMATPALLRVFARMGASPAKAKKLLTTSVFEAMAACEEALAKTLDNIPVLLLLGEAAAKEDGYFVSAEALTRAVELKPDDFEMTRKLVDYLQKAGQADEAVKRMQSIALANPANNEIQAEYRAAITFATKQRSNKGGVAAFAKVDKGGATIGSKSAAILQLLEGTLYDAHQAKQVAVEIKKILAEGESMDLRRKLAACYVLMGDFDKAIEELNRVIAANATYDPMLDKLLEDAEVGRYDKAILYTRRRPPKDGSDPAEIIRQLEEAKSQCHLDHALSRIENYPTDIGLIYDLGKLYLQRGEIDLAIEQFEKSVKSTRCEIISRVALAECFEKKGDLDKAVSLLEEVLAPLSKLDKEWPTSAYALAGLEEKRGNADRAYDFYKQIFEVEPRFRDVAERVKAKEEPAAENVEAGEPQESAQEEA